MISKHIQSMGADVELFLKDKRGRLQSAIGLIGGDKENPLDVPYGNLQEDNVLAEFAINPATTRKQFHHNIQSVAESLTTALPGYRFSHRSFHWMPHHLMDNDKANEFGCDPDLDCYSKTNRTPPTPEKMRYSRGHARSAGGHLHFGIQGIDVTLEGPMMSLARALDFYVGLPLRLADPGTTSRDKVYGGYGAIRMKPYGFEYRTPSNYWVFNHERIEWVLRNSIKAIELMFSFSKKKQPDRWEDFIVASADSSTRTPDWIGYYPFQQAKKAHGMHQKFEIEMDRLWNSSPDNYPKALEQFYRRHPTTSGPVLLDGLGIEPVPDGKKASKPKKEAA